MWVLGFFAAALPLYLNWWTMGVEMTVAVLTVITMVIPLINKKIELELLKHFDADSWGYKESIRTLCAGWIAISLPIKQTGKEHLSLLLDPARIGIVGPSPSMQFSFEAPESQIIWGTLFSSLAFIRFSYINPNPRVKTLGRVIDIWIICGLAALSIAAFIGMGWERTLAFNIVGGLLSTAAFALQQVGRWPAETRRYKSTYFLSQVCFLLGAFNIVYGLPAAIAIRVVVAIR